MCDAYQCISCIWRSIDNILTCHWLRQFKQACSFLSKSSLETTFTLLNFSNGKNFFAVISLAVPPLLHVFWEKELVPVACLDVLCLAGTTLCPLRSHGSCHQWHKRLPIFNILLTETCTIVCTVEYPFHDQTVLVVWVIFQPIVKERCIPRKLKWLQPCGDAHCVKCPSLFISVHHQAIFKPRKSFSCSLGASKRLLTCFPRLFLTVLVTTQFLSWRSCSLHQIYF